MKGLAFIIASILLIFSASCDESVNVKGDFRQKFVLNSILRGDTNFQVVTLSKSFEVDGFDPYANTDDQWIKGARIRIWIGDSVYVFRDSSIARQDTSIYNFPVSFYYHNDLTLKIDKTAKIEAIVPEGKILTAETKIPEQIEFDGLTSSRIIPPPTGDILHFEWIPGDRLADQLYTPRLWINYIKNENGINRFRRKQVPIKFVERDGIVNEYYALPNFSNVLEIDTASIRRAMNTIPEEGENKIDYRIIDAHLEVIVYDQNLTGFYVASNLLDDYSIRIDEIDFTNVNGGLGVFGSYIFNSWTISFSDKYLINLGFSIY